MSNADRNDYIVAMAEAKREYERYLLASKRSRPNTRVDSKRPTPDVPEETVAALEAIVPDSMLQEIVKEATAPDFVADLAPDVTMATPETVAPPAPPAAPSTARKSRKKTG